MSTLKMAAATVWMAASGAALGAQEPITVVIFDHVGMAESTLEKAADTSRKIFATAGVETNWILCRVSGASNQHCRLPPGSFLQAHILPRPVDRVRYRDDLGFALIETGVQTVTSYVFSEPVKTLADSAEASGAVVLGCVMAHEIGHLAGLPHGTDGIMKAQFGRDEILHAERHDLNFSRKDAKVLKAFTGDRLNLAASVIP